MIGFDSQSGLIYEGESSYGYGLWPTPIVTIATRIVDSDSYSSIPARDDLTLAMLVFREDSFDPVTRIRRGRFYFNRGSQPVHWRAFPQSFSPTHALQNMQLVTYERWRAAKELRQGQSYALIALGIADAYTLWRVVDVERVSTGDDLVTLRARTSLGLLPELLDGAIPERGRQHIVSLIEKVSQAAYRAGPESVIDRCRDASQACIGLWLADRTGNEKIRTLDLSPLLDRVEKELPPNALPLILLSTARIIARLHARKPNEQLKKDLRENVEGDAEAALVNLGLLLREIGWTRE
ncbi:MAG: hypothetical protein NDI91_16615 [Sulfuritalea sp.]|nr:hypothetical protein [Sulfuritalea sp.]